jgi:hypothetical protein
VSQKKVTRTTRASATMLSDSEDSEPEVEPLAEDEIETAEDILERTVKIITPVEAKKAATKLIAAKK